MEKLKSYISKYGFYGILICLGIHGCKSSANNRELKKEIKTLRESVYSREESDMKLRILGLETEKRLLQSTDRKILDVKRQSEIDNEINLLKDQDK